MRIFINNFIDYIVWNSKFINLCIIWKWQWLRLQIHSDFWFDENLLKLYVLKMDNLYILWAVRVDEGNGGDRTGQGIHLKFNYVLKSKGNGKL